MKYKVILDVENPYYKETIIQRAKVIDACRIGDEPAIENINTMIARGLPMDWIALKTNFLPVVGDGYYGLFLDREAVILSTDMADVVNWLSVHKCECLVNVTETDDLDKDSVKTLSDIFTTALSGINATTTTYGECWDRIDTLLEDLGKIATKIAGVHYRANYSYGTLKLTKQEQEVSANVA